MYSISLDDITRYFQKLEMDGYHYETMNGKPKS